MPKLIGVQAEGSNYMAEVWAKGEDVVTKPPIDAATAADSISAGLPRDRIKALRAVIDTGGGYVTVPDDEILRAIPDLAQRTGVFAEPAAAAAYAGLPAALDAGLVAADERIVVLSTGSGLKDIGGAMRGVAAQGGAAHRVSPSLEALQQAMAELER